MKITAILLAGGRGRRMQSPLPKQYLPLEGKPIASHSLHILQEHPAIHDMIVVSAPEYRHYFADYPVRFAEPGERRQDSLFNGLQFAETDWICIHDAARPFLTSELLTRLIEEGKEVGAATLALPMKYTVKEGDQEGFVRRTIDRRQLWEIQTPQLLTKDLLMRGFAYANRHNITVTDDVSLAELIGHPVKLVLGSSQNTKITAPEDLCLSTN